MAWRTAQKHDRQHVVLGNRLGAGVRALRRRQCSRFDPFADDSDSIRGKLFSTFRHRAFLDQLEQAALLRFSGRDHSS